jgi:D-alanyl-lipoteichoic acid acyltransferase DltB (MBOAT superfamily)
LSTWLRDYLYIPLGGNRGDSAKLFGNVLLAACLAGLGFGLGFYFADQPRAQALIARYPAIPWIVGGLLLAACARIACAHKQRALTARNLMLTMIIGGLWHGAAWTFVLWGVLHALGLVIQQLVRPLTARLPDAGPRSWPWKLLGWFVAFHLWCLFFVPFRAVDIAHAGELARILWTDRSIGMAGAWLVPALVYVAPLIVVEAFQRIRRDDEAVLRVAIPVRASVYAVVFAALVLLGEDHARPFIYFQF